MSLMSKAYRSGAAVRSGWTRRNGLSVRSRTQLRAGDLPRRYRPFGPEHSVRWRTEPSAGPAYDAPMSEAVGRITECPEYVRVDFGAADSMEISATYRSFADRYLGKPARHVLLEAGDNDPSGHVRLPEALQRMARAIPPDFKLALVASTSAVDVLYREAQQRLRAIGLNAWVFESRADAVAWLEGRSRGGLMTS